MRSRFFELAFTPSVLAEQQRHGSRTAYARLARGDGTADLLTEREWSFIAARDSCYIASVSETGWPYVQHRGGPPGFLRQLDARTLGWAELGGNRQYVSAGNVAGNDRVAMILMDYPQRRRLKLLGHMHVAEPGERPGLAKRLGTDAEEEIEHLVTVEIEAFDWNCPRHITQRYTHEQVAVLMAPLQSRIEQLEQQLRERADS